MNTFTKIGLGMMTACLLFIGLAHVTYACDDQDATNYDGTSLNDCSYVSAGSATGGNQQGGSPAGGQQPAAGSRTGAQTPGARSPAGGNNGSGGSMVYIQNPLHSRFNSVGDVVQGALEIFSYIVVLFAVLMIIYVGLQFVLAQGNPERMKELKDWLLWIVIGVAVVIGARIIVSVVINTLQATDTVNESVIRNANNALNGR